MRILNKRCTQKGMLMILGFVLAVIYMLVNPTHVRADSAQEGRALSDISQIDESKYPGYKDKLLELQNRYPNWNIKVLYTGLDWNHVIEGEYVIYVEVVDMIMVRGYVPLKKQLHIIWIQEII